MLRLIQKLSVTLVMVVSGFILSADESAVKTDSELWNEGVDFYLSGDATNALRVLKPLVLSKSHGPRAAEVVAKLEYDRGAFEESAAAAQLALRDSPKDARRNRNFTRSVDKLPELRREARLRKSLAKVGENPVGALVSSVATARQLMKDAEGYFTNRAEVAVAESDRLSAAADELAIVWPGLREIVARSVTNEEQAATILTQLDTAERKTQEAARHFGDLSDSAYSSIAESELDFNRFAKLVMGAVPQSAPTALGLGLECQSNAYLDVARINECSWQNEALDYTHIFRSVFPAFARDYEQRAQSDTNLPPFTAENQAKISELSTELEKVQLSLVDRPEPIAMSRACDLYHEIRKLMPPEKGQGGGGSQSQPQAKAKERPQSDKAPPKDDSQDDKPQADPSDGDRSDESKSEPPPEDPKEDEQSDDAKDKDEQEIEAILKKAQERNDEHEANKKARMRKAPLPPNERDW